MKIATGQDSFLIGCPELTPVGSIQFYFYRVVYFDREKKLNPRVAYFVAPENEIKNVIWYEGPGRNCRFTSARVSRVSTAEEPDYRHDLELAYSIRQTPLEAGLQRARAEQLFVGIWKETEES